MFNVGDEVSCDIKGVVTQIRKAPDGSTRYKIDSVSEGKNWVQTWVLDATNDMLCLLPVEKDFDERRDFARDRTEK